MHADESFEVKYREQKNRKDHFGAFATYSIGPLLEKKKKIEKILFKSNLKVVFFYNY